MKKVLLDFHKGTPVSVYGDNVIPGEDKKTIHKMAACLGVSYTALLIRLKELRLLDYRPLHEYVDARLRGGTPPWL